MKSFNTINQLKLGDNNNTSNKRIQFNNSSCCQRIKNDIMSVFLKEFFI